MKNSNSALSRRNFVTGAALLTASGIAFARQPTVSKPRLKAGAIDEMVPKQIGEWEFESASGLVLPPSDEYSDRLYDEIVTRVYSRDGYPPMMLLVAYSNLQDGMLQVHRPETCYPVGGYTLSESRELAVPLLSGLSITNRYFSAESVGRSEQVMYWTRIGEAFPSRWIDQRWAVVEENLRGRVPDGILVRFSTINPDADLALNHMKQFAAEMVMGMTPRARQLFVGRA